MTVTTYLIRIEGPRRFGAPVGHGELMTVVGDALRARGYTYERLSVTAETAAETEETLMSKYVPFTWTARTMAEQMGVDPTTPAGASDLLDALVREGCTPKQSQAAVMALREES